MVKTGYISFIMESGGGFDENGNPIAATKINSEFYPCNLAVQTKEYKLLVEGQYQQAKFSIIIDNSLIYSLDLSNLTQIQLNDLRNNDLGIFQVQNKEFLDLTNRLKLVV